jgi:hypothetical protein
MISFYSKGRHHTLRLSEQPKSEQQKAKKALMELIFTQQLGFERRHWQTNAMDRLPINLCFVQDHHRVNERKVDDSHMQEYSGLQSGPKNGGPHGKK